MKEDSDKSLRPYDFSQIADEVSELGKFNVGIDAITFNPIIDSSDVEPAFWQRLADLVRRKYDGYDGFVILHGTDTMAYSASALSFMLDALDKPVVFTGSQLPVGLPRTDGKENLISAIEIAAAKEENGEATVPEVCIFFNSQLFRGNRTTKINAAAFDAFSSPNFPPLAEAGISIKYNKTLIRRPESRKFSVHEKIDTRVSILKLHPGITENVVKNILLGDNTRAVIIETYGSGNAISRPWFTEIVRQACDSGRILVNVTQCLAGEVNMDLYATGKTLKDAGVVSGGDMTTEGALAKLFHLMGEYDDNETVKKLFSEDLRGEMSK